MSGLAIFIPAYNEEKTIGSVVLLARKYGKVWVVDDGSSDQTARLAHLAGAQVIRHRKNLGYGTAMKSAFAQARKGDAEVVVTLDADFQHDPQEIPLVAEPVASGKADVCIGSRFLGKFVEPPSYRKTGVRLLNRLAGMQAEDRSVDFQCGFRAFSRSAVGKIRFRQNRYAAASEIVVSAMRQGLKIAEVPVSVRYYGGNGGAAIAQGAGIFTYIVGAIAKRKPLLFFAGTGFAMLLASGLLGLFVVDTFYSRAVLPIGSAFLTVFFGIVGLVLILIGINLYTLEAVLERKEKGEI